MAASVRGWRIASLALGLLSAAALLVSFAYLPNALSNEGRGVLGIEGQVTRVGNSSAVRIERLHPDSPLKAAGVVVGDSILAPPRGRLAVRQEVRLQVVHGQQIRTVNVRAVPATSLGQPPGLTLFELALALLSFGLGALLVVRRSRDPTALALGGALFLAAAGLAPLAVPTGWLAVIVETWYAFAPQIIVLMLALVAQSMVTSPDRLHRSINRAALGLGILQAAAMGVMGAFLLGYGIPAPRFSLNGLRMLLQGLALLLCIVAYARAWRQVEDEQRERMRWIFLGIGCAILAAATVFVGFSGLMGSGNQVPLWTSIVADLLTALALVTMTYAILRHRVLDVGFAISRALIYAILTGLMLIGFGLAEWLADQLLEFEQRRQHAWIDGALAVGIFLLFHPLQHWIRQVVERIFFRKWRAKEAALESFLDGTAQFSDADALARALLDAIDTYTESAGTALYLRDARGRLVRRLGTLSDAMPVFETDDPLVIGLKASPGEPMYLPSSGDGNSTSWTFPYARRGELIAFVRVAGKRSRDVYRPDEIANVARAVQRVGFDLYALQLETARFRPQQWRLDTRG